jgi:hypothetical protein
MRKTLNTLLPWLERVEEYRRAALASCRRLNARDLLAEAGRRGLAPRSPRVDSGSRPDQNAAGQGHVLWTGG